MCIVLDANTIAVVFDSSNTHHADFAPIRRWVFLKEGKLVLGGTKYRLELSRLKKYASALAELSRAQKIVLVHDKSVDDEQARIELTVGANNCNDCHLIALISVSGCRLICTTESDALPFIKRSELYRKGVARPRIYSSKKNADLLCKKYFAKCCA